MLTLEVVKELLDYDHNTGVFTRKIRCGNQRKGTIVGSRNGNGYLKTHIDGNKYFLHRLAWFMHFEVWPSENIDHINEDKTDNRIENLRDCSQHHNMLNTRKTVGVTVIKGGKHKAQIKLYGRQVNLGHFDTFEEARERYLSFKKELGYDME